jgi:thioesterase superfamily protein 4
MVVLRPDFSKRSSQYQIPTNVVSQLGQTPWCASILDDSVFLPLQSHSRTPPPYLVGRYSFMNRTLATAETIPIWQGFYRPSSNLDPDDIDYGEVRVLIVLGSGMDGHLHTAHGGVAATLLDEAMGTVAGIHKTPGRSIFTAFMHVDYKKPLPTPSVVMIKAKLDPRSRGRKLYIRATLEDGTGTIFTAAEALFLEVERKPRPKI